MKFIFSTLISQDHIHCSWDTSIHWLLVTKPFYFFQQLQFIALLTVLNSIFCLFAVGLSTSILFLRYTFRNKTPLEIYLSLYSTTTEYPTSLGQISSDLNTNVSSVYKMRSSAIKEFMYIKSRPSQSFPCSYLVGFQGLFAFPY